MTTPSEEAALGRFAAAVEGVVGELGFLYAHTPDGAVNASLSKLAATLRSEWRHLTRGEPEISDDDIAGAVADLVDRVRIRRRELEGAGAAGRA